MNKIIARLRELMEEEKIYRQFDLKLDERGSNVVHHPAPAFGIYQ